MSPHLIHCVNDMIHKDEREQGLLEWMGPQIEVHSGVPIYLQLRGAFTRALQRGTLRPGDPLPTVRATAGALRLAPNTVIRAYGELQRSGLIESRAGAGTVVSAQALKLLGGAEHQAALLDELRDVLHRLAASGLSGPALWQTLQTLSADLDREAR